MIKDNGVEQRVSLLAHTENVAATMVLDVSGSMTQQKLENAGAGVRAMLAGLADGDRASLYAFAADVREIPRPHPRGFVPTATIARAFRDRGGPYVALRHAVCRNRANRRHSG